MTQTIDDFVAGLRQLIVRWEADVRRLQAVGQPELANQVEIWIADAQRLIEKHEANVYA